MFGIACAQVVCTLPVLICGQNSMGHAPDFGIIFCCVPAMCCLTLVYIFELVVVIWINVNKFSADSVSCYTEYTKRSTFIDTWLIITYALIGVACIDAVGVVVIEMRRRNRNREQA